MYLQTNIFLSAKYNLDNFYLSLLYVYSNFQFKTEAFFSYICIKLIAKIAVFTGYLSNVHTWMAKWNFIHTVWTVNDVPVVRLSTKTLPTANQVRPWDTSGPKLLNTSGRDTLPALDISGRKHWNKSGPKTSQDKSAL